MKTIVILKSFPGHAGRQGQVGGSLPRDDDELQLDNTDKVLNTPSVLSRLKIPRYMYHVTNASNLENIKKDGLRSKGVTRISQPGHIRGIYITSNPNDIIRHQDDIYIENPIILKIDTSNLKLRLDPEYYYYDDTTTKGANDYVDAINNGEEEYAMYSRESIPSSAIVQYDAGSRLKTFEGHSGIPGHQGGSLARSDFWTSPAGIALHDFAKTHDFVLGGSAALSLYIHGKLGRDINDIDIYDLTAKVNIDKYVNLDDPRSLSSTMHMQHPNGVTITAYKPGQEIDTTAGARAPRYNYEDTKVIDGIRVIPLKVLLTSKLDAGRDKDYADIEKTIITMQLPRNYINMSSYRSIYDNIKGLPVRVTLKSFPDHEGIPGHQGGSLPRGDTFTIDPSMAGQREISKRAVGGTWPTTDNEHYYHATKMTNLSSIRENGLVPMKKGVFTGYSTGKKVSLTTNDSDNVNYWTSMAVWAEYDRSRLIHDMTVVRVKKSDVTNTSSHRTDEVNVDSVPSDKLEFWNKDHWEQL